MLLITIALNTISVIDKVLILILLIAILAISYGTETTKVLITTGFGQESSTNLDVEVYHH